jgi:hypothetical protein
VDRAEHHGGSAILGYIASASAVSQPTLTCVTGGATSCTISGLASGVVYGVTVTASNAAGTGAASAATPSSRSSQRQVAPLGRGTALPFP